MNTLTINKFIGSFPRDFQVQHTVQLSVDFGDGFTLSQWES